MIKRLVRDRIPEQQAKAACLSRLNAIYPHVDWAIILYPEQRPKPPQRRKRKNWWFLLQQAQAEHTKLERTSALLNEVAALARSQYESLGLSALSAYNKAQDAANKAARKLKEAAEHLESTRQQYEADRKAYEAEYFSRHHQKT
jgi:ElaB/YqjD/DUF883 family membrane-anchored ribosome-binding protein